MHCLLTKAMNALSKSTLRNAKIGIKCEATIYFFARLLLEIHLCSWLLLTLTVHID